MIAAWCKRPDVTKQDIENMMRMLLGLPEPEEAEDGARNPGFPNHRGRKGHRGGSLPKGAGSPAHEKKTASTMRTHAKQYANVRNGLYGDDTEYAVYPFRGKELSHHHAEHRKKMGFKSDAEYAAAGIDFMSSPLDKWSEEMLTKRGDRVRYSYLDNSFGVVNPDGTLKTFFDTKEYHKDNPDNYWEEKMKYYGEH